MGGHVVHQASGSRGEDHVNSSELTETTLLQHKPGLLNECCHFLLKLYCLQAYNHALYYILGLSLEVIHVV